MSSGPGAPPPVPTEFQIYDSYVIDPIWQGTFTKIWGIALGIVLLFSAPYLVRSLWDGRAWTSVGGVWEDLSGKCYQPVVNEEKLPTKKEFRLRGLVSALKAPSLWSLPGLELDLGQILVLIGYGLALVVCIVMQSELVDNPNRAGFLTLAQFPVVFLFATKNSLLSFFLGPGHGWEKLNYIHRWSGRGMFLAATIHGSLWIRNHLQFGLPILGQQKETSGVAAYGLICVIVLSSLKPVRRWAYQWFFVIHVLAFVAFFITVCYHTIYASPWIFPPLAFYGLDMLVRMFRYRFKDATLVPIDNQMTLINVHDCDGGWLAGQHVRLRVFFKGRFFESHPLTILSAPPSTSCLSSRTLILGARVAGDWTRALNSYALLRQRREEKMSSDTGAGGMRVHVMLDGPYGGCSIDLGAYESVLLVAGGAGATFTLGLLDDIVGRCVRLGRRGGERTRRIEFAWCTKSFASLEWFAPMLFEIATTAATSSILDLHISVFVTCLCDPEAVPTIPNMDVIVARPDVHNLLQAFINPPSTTTTTTTSAIITSSPASSLEEDRGDIEKATEFDVLNAKLRWVGVGGGVAVCASGPETLTRSASNAVARVGVAGGVRLGGLALHTELFAL